IHESKRGNDRAHAHCRGTLVDRRGRRQKKGAPQLHSSLAFAHSMRRSAAPGRDAPRARAQSRLSARTDSERALRAVGLLIQRYVFVLSLELLDGESIRFEFMSQSRFSTAAGTVSVNIR